MIQTMKYDLPTEYLEDVANGTVEVAASVLRDTQTGEIVKHFPAIKTEDLAEASNGALANIAQFCGEHKILTGAGTIGALAVIGYEGYEHLWVPYFSKVVREFKKAFKEYKEDLENGNLSEKSIDKLDNALTKLRSDKNYDKFKIKLSLKEMDVLLVNLNKYTKELAREKEVTLTEDELQRSSDSIIDIQKYLKAQKRILQATA